MKKAVWGYSIVVFLVCGIILFLCTGCETVKGMGRDIKDADQWMRDNAW